MDEAENPAWYSIAYTIFTLLFIGLLSFGNSLTEHKRPIKKFKERSYKYNSSQNPEGMADTLDSIEPIEKVNLSKDTLSIMKDSLSAPIPPLEANKSEKKSSAHKSDKEFFADLVDNYRTTVLAKLKRPEDRSDVVLRYYSKEKDGDKVYAMRKYGFYIHERPSDPSYNGQTTNSIYFGDAVKNEDIQLVAYVLMTQGVKLKQIIPSKLHDDWKANSIEIGTDSIANNLPDLKLSDIRKSWH